MESGKELVIEELSEEEDADFYEDNRLQMNVMMVTNPLIAKSQ